MIDTINIKKDFNNYFNLLSAIIFLFKLEKEFFARNIKASIVL